MLNQIDTNLNIRKEFARLASFGANIADAYSCFIFVPSSIVNALMNSGTSRLSNSDDELYLAGYHTLSNDVVDDCIIPVGTGLAGWVAKHGQLIHVSPFDRDSTTLGIYRHDQTLKSFVAVPTKFSFSSSCGVVACDSKKSFAFSHLQIKLLTNLSEEVSQIIQLCIMARHNLKADSSWESFIERGYELATALGSNSVEVLRVKPTNLEKIEQLIGTAQAVDLYDRVLRLIYQALPPHFPMFKLPNGEIVVVLDNMMVSFFQNKIVAVASHISVKGNKLEFAFRTGNSRVSRTGRFVLEDIISDTCPENEITLTTRGGFGVRRRA